MSARSDDEPPPAEAPPPRRSVHAGLAGVAAVASLTAPALSPFFVAAVALEVRGARAGRAMGGYDALVVAGCRVASDGTPSPALVRRCELAARLYRRGVAPILVVTGGSIEGRPAEADVAAALLERDCPRAPVLRERASRRTDENASEAARLLGRGARVLVVTDTYHVVRCVRIFGRHFDRAEAVGARGPAIPTFRGAMRELVALAADLVREGQIADFVRILAAD